MSRNRFENLEFERQQKLFESAAEEFGAHGYDAASLNRILDRSGMSKSSLYYYFDDKADLFTTMFERAVGFLIKEVGGFDLDALTADNYWSELEAVYQRAMITVNKSTWFVKLGRAFYRMRGNQRQPQPMGRIFEAAQHWVDLVIRRGQALGVVRQDLPQTLLIDAAMGLGEALDHWTVEHWDEMSAQDRLEMVSKQVDMFRDLFSP